MRNRISDVRIPRRAAPRFPTTGLQLFWGSVVQASQAREKSEELLPYVITEPKYYHSTCLSHQ